MRSQRTTLIAVLLAVAMAGAIFAPLGAGASGPLPSSATTTETVSDDPTTATIDASLNDETGPTELWLVLPGVATTDLQGGPDAVVDALKARAAVTQEPVVAELERLDGVAVEDTFWIRNSVRVTADLDRVDLETLAAIDGVERLEPTVEFEVPDLVPVSNPVEPRDDHVTYGLDQLNVTEAWEELGATGEGVRVVVADTGVHADHQDIDLTEENGWNDIFNNESEPVDRMGHGTHVSGTIAGGDASGTAIGVAPDADLAHAKVCDSTGSCADADVMAAFEWAVETDSDVINFSLGTTELGTFADVVHNTMEAGTLVVAGSGNENEGSVITPAAAYDSISVGATNEEREIALFSSGDLVSEGDFDGNYYDHWPGEFIVPDAAAPGVAIYSARAPDAWMLGCQEGEYCTLQGTSMATPHVTGVAALVLSANPDLGPRAVKDVILESTWKPDSWDPSEADHFNPETGRDSRYGMGIVDAYEAVQLAAEPGVAEFDVEVAGTNSPVTEGEDLVVDATVENVGDASGEQTVELADLGGMTADSASVSLEANESTSIQLTWSTKPGDAGSGEVTVSSSDHGDSVPVEIQSDESDPGCELPGDVDGDGQVSSLDATKTQRFIAGLEPDTFDEDCADLDEDGDITPADVTAIHQTIVGS
ncbi:S8 family serine peptidase [Halovivax limisalsi]|uniref:S8 family serine peptidase n=1 Tax=Halovivax limisalsi TaxID=1453760 RepID=UPI001FFC7589|nr:S8 family serine peptidase [Halovivax limisalsi]